MRYLVLILIMFFLTSCMEDFVEPSPPNSSNSAKLLTYMEANYDQLFDPQLSLTIDVDSLFINKGSFLILDTRSESEYNTGHIASSINVQPKDLVNYINSADNSKDIVLISKNGQAAAYYMALLRILGHYNIRFLEYGMSIWHEDFSDDWATVNSNFSRVGTFDPTIERKSEFQELPQVTAQSTVVSEIVLNRVQELLQSGYQNIQKQIDYFYGSYDGAKLLDAQIICYGPLFLYRSFELGHPPGAVQFIPPDELRSTQFIQTLPSNKEIGVYDWNGHISAVVTAYLRVIGYNAYNLHFGAYAMIYEDFLISSFKKRFILTKNKIRNYPYQK